jgi:hypothetical protein
MLRLIQVNRVVRPADYKAPVSMRKRIGGGKDVLLAIGGLKKFFFVDQRNFSPVDDITGRKRSFSSLQRLRPVRRPHLILVSSAISSTIYDSQRGTLEPIDPYFSVPHFFVLCPGFANRKMWDIKIWIDDFSTHFSPALFFSLGHAPRRSPELSHPSLVPQYVSLVTPLL